MARTATDQQEKILSTLSQFSQLSTKKDQQGLLCFVSSLPGGEGCKCCIGQCAYESDCSHLVQAWLRCVISLAIGVFNVPWSDGSSRFIFNLFVFLLAVCPAFLWPQFWRVIDLQIETNSSLTRCLSTVFALADRRATARTTTFGWAMQHLDSSWSPAKVPICFIINVETVWFHCLLQVERACSKPGTANCSMWMIFLQQVTGCFVLLFLLLTFIEISLFWPTFRNFNRRLSQLLWRARHRIKKLDAGYPESPK